MFAKIRTKFSNVRKDRARIPMFGNIKEKLECLQG